MVMLQVHEKTIKIKYKTFLLSQGAFIVLICSVLTVVLPYVLSHRSGGFWQKWDEIYEQPNVKFLGDFLLLATTSDDDRRPIICSSFGTVKVQSFDRCSSIEVQEVDEDHDGKFDRLHIRIDAKLDRRVKVTSVHLILPLNYSLENLPCDLYIETAVIYQNFVINDASHVSIYGDLDFKQSEPIRCFGSESAKDPHTPVRLESLDLSQIVATYSGNKIKTPISNLLISYKPWYGEPTFTVSLTLTYPQHRVYFHPQMWQLLKFAWIQYLALYVIVWRLAREIKHYIFRNNLVVLYEDKTDMNKR